MENNGNLDFIIDRDSPDYPADLGEWGQPPERLYGRGDRSLLKSPMVAVVGTRKNTAYGSRMARRIARTLTDHGVTVVSGLALGIDTLCLKACLSRGGAPVAVLAAGLDILYPVKNGELKEEIGRRGLLLTEYPLGTRPDRWHFPMRNRIIAGLCKAVILAEAGLNSGSLIVAELAMTLGRPVYAVPGNADSPDSVGCNLLLRDGATPFISSEEVLRDLGLFREEVSPPGGVLSPRERALLALLSREGEMDIPAISAALSESPAKINGLVGVLVMKGMVDCALGKVFLAN